MAVIPHPPYSPDLAPCDLFLVPKMKLKLKGRWFDTIDEIQAESQSVLDALMTEKDIQKLSKNEEDGGTGVYMWEGTTSRVMVSNRPYGEFYDFYSISPEYFGYHHILLIFQKFLEPCRRFHDSNTQDWFIRANQSLTLRYYCTIYSLLVNLVLLSIAYTIYFLMTG
jgi:hypothetical protein